MTSSASKAALRREALARRAEAAREDPVAGERLARSFGADLVPASDTPRWVGGYWPLAGEIDPRPLMSVFASSGAGLCLPVVKSEGVPLEFRQWRPGNTLIKGQHGVREPGPEAPCVVPDLMLVPLVAVDQAGNRLGLGKGYYDRTLARLRKDSPVIAIGLAHDAQVFDRVPADAHDEHLDILVTPTKILRFSE